MYALCCTRNPEKWIVRESPQRITIWGAAYERARFHTREDARRHADHYFANSERYMKVVKIDD